MSINFIYFAYQFSITFLKINTNTGLAININCLNTPSKIYNH